MALPQDRTIAPGKFPEKVRKFMSPDAPPPMKLMVARGLVPMKPLVQMCALYQLAVTGDEQVQKTAVETVRRMPATTVEQVATQPLLPVVLDWMAQVFDDNASVVQAVLLNRQTDDDTFIEVAKTADEATCELIARNEQRLLGQPAIIETLYFNQNLRASTADRMIDLAVRNDVDLSALPCYEEIVAAIKGTTVPRDDASSQAADAAFKQAKQAVESLDDDTADEVADALSKEDEEPEEEETRSKSAAARIRDLNVAQKVRLAVMGGKTERKILIRDTNKVVARSVIRSPAVSDAEAIGYAKNKALLDEVVTYMCTQRKWTRHYQMKLALVGNPKTPLSEAMKFLSHLRPGDLRSVSRSKNVPPPVSKAAKQLLKARMK